MLGARIRAAEVAKRQQAEASTRRNLLGSGDRSDRNRTYNFPQGRVTDHRINLTLYRLDEAMEGKLDMLIEPIVRGTSGRSAGGAVRAGMMTFQASAAAGDRPPGGERQPETRRRDLAGTHYRPGANWILAFGETTLSADEAARLEALPGATPARGTYCSSGRAARVLVAAAVRLPGDADPPARIPNVW